jgi:hypothetical protein
VFEAYVKNILNEERAAKRARAQVRPSFDTRIPLA